MLLLHDKRSIRKFKLLKWSLTSDNITTLQRIAEEVECHPNTASVLANEVNSDLEDTVFNSKGKIYSIQTRNVRNISKYYACLVKDDIYFQILNELLILQNSHSLDSLADKLFVSRSKIYTSISKLNKNFNKLGFYIDVASTFKIKSDIFSLTNLIFELLLKENQESFSDFTLEKKIEGIFSCFGIREDSLNQYIYKIWIMAFFISKRCRHNKNFEIKEEKISLLNLHFPSQYREFYDLIGDLATHFSCKKIEEIDYFILFSGLFFSSLYIKDKNKNYSFYKLHEEIFGDFSCSETTRRLEIELFRYFGLDSVTEVDNAYLKNGLHVLLRQYDIYKIRYIEFLNTENMNKCPVDILDELRNLDSFSFFCQEKNYSREDQNNILELVWFIFKSSFYISSTKLKSGVIFKSTFGEKKEQTLKNGLIEVLFPESNKESSLTVVDDVRLINSPSTIHIDNFIEDVGKVFS